MTITELMNKRANTWDAMKKLLDEKTDETGLVTAEDAAQYDRMEQEYNDLTNQIERTRRAAEIENEMNKAVREPITGKPGMRNEQDGKGRASKAYDEAFMKWMRTRNDAVTPEIRNALQVGTDTEGGYLVPEEFEKKLIMALEEENIFRRLATVIRTGGERIIPMETARGEAAWVEEEQLIPESDAAFGQIRIGAHKLATRIKISNELMQDSAFDMASYIAGNFGRRMGEKEEDAFFNGDGSGKPLGIMAATGGAQVGVTASGDITFDNVIELYHSLRLPYRRKAVFLISDATAMALRKVKDGNQQYIWQTAVTADRPDMLFGRPVYTSRFMPAPTTGNIAMLFGNMKYYWIADRTTRTFKRLNELYAETDQTGFITTQRVDGKLILPEAVKALKMG